MGRSIAQPYGISQFFRSLENIWIVFPDVTRRNSNDGEVSFYCLAKEPIFSECLTAHTLDVVNDELAMCFDVLECLDPTRKNHKQPSL